MENASELLPDYLNFVRGVIDSEDLPLNISRESLQQNKILKVIKKNLTKKALEMFSDISQDSDDYKKFYEAFSKSIKLGVHEDSQNRSKFAELLRYKSNYFTDETVSFKDYISRSHPKLKRIYYIIGDSYESVKKSPFVERLFEKGIEVLIMTDPMDEYAMQQLKEFDGYKFVCVTKEGLHLDELGEEEQKNRDELVSTFASLCELIKEVLGDLVEKVIVSERISTSPAVLVTGEYGWTANMERIMKAQALRDSSMQNYMVSKKTFEINPYNKIILELRRRVDLDKSDRMLRDLCYLLYEITLITSGFQIQDSTKFSERICRILELGLNIQKPVYDEDLDIDGNYSKNDKRGHVTYEPLLSQRKSHQIPVVD